MRNLNKDERAICKDAGSLRAGLVNVSPKYLAARCSLGAKKSAIVSAYFAYGDRPFRLMAISNFA